MPHMVLAAAKERFVDFHDDSRATNLFGVINEVRDCYIPQELFPIDNHVIGDPQLLLDVELGQTPGRPGALRPLVRQADHLPQLEMRKFKETPLSDVDNLPALVVRAWSPFHLEQARVEVEQQPWLRKVLLDEQCGKRLVKSYANRIQSVVDVICCLFSIMKAHLSDQLG